MKNSQYFVLLGILNFIIAKITTGFHSALSIIFAEIFAILAFVYLLIETKYDL